MEDKLYEQSYTVKRVAGFATHAYTMPNRKHVVYGMVCGHAPWTSDIGHRPQSCTRVGRPAGRVGSGHEIYKY